MGKDLDFDFEVLDLAAQSSDEKLMVNLVEAIAPFLQTEGDFQDLLRIACDFYIKNRQAEKVGLIEKILHKRSSLSCESTLEANNSDLKMLLDSFSV